MLCDVCVNNRSELLIQGYIIGYLCEVIPLYGFDKSYWRSETIDNGIIIILGLVVNVDVLLAGNEVGTSSRSLLSILIAFKEPLFPKYHYS